MKSSNAEDFFHAIGKAKKTNQYGPFVEQHSLSDYANMQMFLTVDGQAGIAIEPDGNIVSVFNGGKEKKVSYTMLLVALANGGNKLDCFDGFLALHYAMFGFQPIARVKFNDKFAPDDWNYERDGRPDIIFWIHNGDSWQNVIQRLGTYPLNSSEAYFESYDEAKVFRDAILKRQISEGMEEIERGNVIGHQELFSKFRDK